MTDRDILVPAAVLSLIRGHDSVLGVADRLGITESQVLELHDVFLIGGLVAVADFRRGLLQPYGSAAGWRSRDSVGASPTLTPEPAEEAALDEPT